MYADIIPCRAPGYTIRYDDSSPKKYYAKGFISRAVTTPDSVWGALICHAPKNDTLYNIRSMLLGTYPNGVTVTDPMAYHIKVYASFKRQGNNLIPENLVYSEDGALIVLDRIYNYNISLWAYPIIRMKQPVAVKDSFLVALCLVRDRMDPLVGNSLNLDPGLLSGKSFFANGAQFPVFQPLQNDLVLQLEMVGESCPDAGGTIAQNICQGDTLLFGGKKLTSSGTYHFYYTAQNGCDSTVTLTLQVRPVAQTTLQAQICSGESYSFADRQLQAAGTYFDTLQSANGCDSVIMLNLQIRPTSQTNLQAQICSGETYAFAGRPLQAAGTYFDTLQAASGCDSVIILKLQVLPVGSIRTPVAICPGTTYNFSGSKLQVPGVYTKTFKAANGCDSIVTIELSLYPVQKAELGPDLDITLKDTITIKPDKAFSRYWWSADGSTGPVLVLKGSDLGVGIFPIFLEAYDENGCGTKDSLVIRVTSGVNAIQDKVISGIQLYPNPVRAGSELYLSELPPAARGQYLTVLDAPGRVVYQIRLPENNQESISIPAPAQAGWYWIKLRTGDKRIWAGKLVVF